MAFDMLGGVKEGQLGAGKQKAKLIWFETILES